MKSISRKSGDPIWHLKDLGYEAIVSQKRITKSFAKDRVVFLGSTRYGTNAGTTDIAAAVSSNA